MKSYLFILALLFHAPLFAAGGHGHGHDDTKHQEPAEGPHGGRFLESDDLNLEITIFESGIPPEMRIYLYSPNGTAIKPDEIAMTVNLNRTGGQQDLIDFSSEANYLLGDAEIVEPHSFEVEVNANYKGNNYHWHFESFEGRAEIPPRLLEMSEVETEIASAKTVTVTNTVYGIVTKAEDQVFHVHAPYSGIVQSVDVETGDKVKKGQRLLTVLNQKNLQTYTVNSPASGEITLRPVKRGDHTNMGTLIEVSDLSSVWVEMSMFPKDIEAISKGMPVIISDLHGEHSVESKLDYLSPQMTGGHIARARATIANPNGEWRPGMHVMAEVIIERVEVPLAVKRSALQTFRDMPVVFGRFDNVFEVRMVQLGRQDNDYVEVTGGLEPGTEYVTNNSYLLKAEVLKDGASHDH
ncbi:efflux RND transporter periplasmic adaptor subunit [Methylophaga thiooxydans]|uniref:Efflux transporter, RND family, MFP subunit n=1 Tax=Methylophaga thiooxydans DMS010 TaxID=637616 RepID=C0N444_9GAMM|nr:efflux RND transporter periplasmic adaptor subunit [Methylophaga thiooxydans]EEF80565.1 efflux transporter, RND family, MFP subunit [Methylophaga thiooxydans DMS010]